MARWDGQGVWLQDMDSVGFVAADLRVALESLGLELLCFPMASNVGCRVVSDRVWSAEPGREVQSVESSRMKVQFGM